MSTHVEGLGGIEMLEKQPTDFGSIDMLLYDETQILAPSDGEGGACDVRVELATLSENEASAIRNQSVVTVGLGDFRAE